MKDLILLVADKNSQFALRGALQRPKALGIRPIRFEFLVHPGRDGGTRRTGPEILNLEAARFRNAVLVLDFEGCGSEHSLAAELESELDARLRKAWSDRAKAIVIEPEVDIWLWGSDNALQQIVSWNEPPSIRTWLQQQGFQFDARGKPNRPKEAIERVVRDLSMPRSSSLYEEITSRLSLSRCVDKAFRKLAATLELWFPQQDPA